MKRIFHLLVVTTLLISNGLSQDGGGTINWNGVKGPYRFEGFFSPKEGIYWTVGGQGQTIYQKFENGVAQEREYHLSDDKILDDSFHSAWFDIEGRGWIVGGNGRIFHSEDNGNSWEQQKSATIKSLEDIDCVDARRCWILGSEVFLRTQDAGKTWERLDNVSGNAVDFIDSEEGWVIDYESVFHTTDGGKTWTETKIITDKNDAGSFQAIKFANKNVGWIAGSHKLGYTDGGKTWKISDFWLQYFVGIVAHDSKSVLAVSSNKYNYCSNDSGKTWRKCFPRQD